MTENGKARELIATSETTVKVDPQNGWYLKRFAALQFEGSVDNFGTNMPIHVLEQQLPKEDTMKLDDAVIEGQEIDYSRFYDEKGNEYSSVSELVQTRLGLDDDDAIQEYNKENPSLPYIPYEKLRDMDKKDIPEMLSSVVDEADYVDAYKEVTHVASYHVEVTPMSNNYEAMGFAFTHQGLKEYEKSIDNHIFYPCRCYAHAGEKYGREAGDFYPIMEFLHSAGEQLLREDIRRYDIKPAVIRTKEEMHEFYRTQPDEIEAVDKGSRASHIGSYKATFKKTSDGSDGTGFEDSINVCFSVEHCAMPSNTRTAIVGLLHDYCLKNQRSLDDLAESEYLGPAEKADSPA